MIKSYPPLVYDSVVDVEHTGDVLWQTALNVTGRGKVEIHLGSLLVAVLQRELRITIDGTLLSFPIPGRVHGYADSRYVVRWNQSLLVEYRVNNVAETAYIDITYYNR